MNRMEMQQEAERLGIKLSQEDLDVIYQTVTQVRAELLQLQLKDSMVVEPTAHP